MFYIDGESIHDSDTEGSDRLNVVGIEESMKEHNALPEPLICSC